MAEPVQFQRRRGASARGPSGEQRQYNQPRQDNGQEQGERQRQRGDGKSWAEWKQELSEAIDQLDYACAEARQIIYKLRPLVRPKGERGQ